MHEGLRGELQADSQERWVCPEDAVRDGGVPIVLGKCLSGVLRGQLAAQA